jgi:RNA recognition motif-containing protein
MKSPQGLTFIVAIVLAVLAYFVSNAIGNVTSTVVAALVLVSTFIAPLISLSSSSESSESSSDEVKTLYVGNLPYRANESSIRELFSEHGQVHSVRLMKDKHTGKRRGFGFVEMSASDADKAVVSLNDTEFQQRTLKVREAKERPEKTGEEE